MNSVGLDQSALTGTHPTILNLIKELEENRQQTNPIPSEEISNDRFVDSSFLCLSNNNLVLDLV